MEFPRRYWKQFDWTLLLAALILTGFGILMIYSASSARLLANEQDPFYYAQRQLIFTPVSLVAMFLAFLVDYRIWRRFVKPIYLLNIILLLSVLFLGDTISGSQRWFRLGIVAIQPAEFAKLFMVLVLARLLERKENITGVKILLPFLLVSAPMILIMLQPDLGTSLVFVGIVFTMLYLAGAHGLHLALIGSGGITAATAAVIASLRGWVQIIQPYQLNRLLVFIDPYADRTHAGWNVIQSMIAVGSGGLFGQGFRSGTQSQLHFLPANHTDFIFSVIAEELGFVGAITVLTLFLFIIWRCIRIAATAKDRFGMLTAMGCASIIAFHVLINVGMTLGIMPVTGLPLPFFSYGGSSLLTIYTALGLVLNVGVQRQRIVF